MLATTVGCAPAVPTHDRAADMAAIGQVRDGFAAAFKAGDAAAIAALYTADAAAMTEGQPTATGPQAIEAMNKATFDTLSAQEISITPGKTEIDGDMAAEWGTTTVTATPKGGSAPMTTNGRYVVILKRQADGTWKLLADIDNSPTPPAAMPMAMPMAAK
jgi:uncharacterized protein (TIGR02246 family)